jgi:opacity protein-like surface antigen
MLKRYAVLLLITGHFFVNQDVNAIGSNKSGARSLGLGNASLTLSDIWSTNNNQAGLGNVTEFGIGFAYENRFGLSELGLKSLNMAVPIKWGTLGLTVQQFGFSDYNENKFGLAYGMKVSKKVRLGIQIDYLLTSIAEAQSQNKSGITAEIGLQADVTDKLTLGAHIFNLPNSSMSGDLEEKIPMIISIGLNYKFSKKVFAVVDLEKNIDLDPNLKVGIEYHPIEALYFRGGLNTYDFHFNGGLGVKLKGFNFDLGFSHQTYLGLVSQASLSFALNKK